MHQWNCSWYETLFPLRRSGAAAEKLQVSSGVVRFKPPFHFVFPSSITLQQSAFMPVFLMCCILNYTICTASIIPPVHSCIANVPFLFFLYKSVKVPVGLMQF
ncbi:hypothetical protein ATANTOWER_026952 [Ataeniobius toweri]|uniref:Uncharacterized protein n=1 Tax=Ataeniobius toweri TaxID=208326 RepID=A0ABU7BSQ6_9TELE|nr:hypothetical protein [Ataeniobius toweri]